MINRMYLKLPDSERDHVQGTIDAPIALLEYGDYECPFCSEVQPIVKEIQRRLGDDLCFAFRHFPLTNVHPHAEHAAEAAEAAAEQRSFWAMHETLFANQDALDDEALAEYAAALGLNAKRLIQEVISGAHAQRVREDFNSGVRAGVNGTPSLFINGQRYDGARGLEPLLAAVSNPASII
ncbi:MAG: disulfide bond formation protein DsbA [Verrucomicrobia bacterium]|nr:MAG: disulfide bond formation protein DsbA [Verrucomicrobiota bacterium]